MDIQKAPKPFIIPLFIPHEGCPHQCVFCNQSAITGHQKKIPDLEFLRRYIDSYLLYKKPERHPVQISFYGGTFLGLGEIPINTLLGLAETYVEHGTVNHIRFSTRPDTVTEETLDLLSGFSVNTVELGVQSMDDRVLFESHRGHTAEDTLNAVFRLRERSYETGLQMMVGLPGSSPGKDLDTAIRLTALKPDFVRIYPTLVLKDSPLARRYHQGHYTPLDLEACVALVKNIYLIFKKNGIPVIRMGLQASEELDQGATVLAGPYHPSFGHLIFSDIFLDMSRMILQKEICPHGEESIVFYVHSKNISKIRGLKNRNLDVLKAEFGLGSIQIAVDDTLGHDCVRTENTRLVMANLYQA
jgi:histone acetyltransferase (RNA polymerase elongator complex component)